MIIFANINLLNIMKRGKRIERVGDFVRGRKYLHEVASQPFTFSHLSSEGSLYFLNEGQGLIPTPEEKGCIGLPSFMSQWYEAIEDSGDTASEIEFERFCSSPFEEHSFDIDEETKNIVDSMMDIVKSDLGVVPLTKEVPEDGKDMGFAYGRGLPDSITCVREITVEQMLTDFSDTLSKEQKVAYEDMIGGGFDHVMVDIETLGTEPGCVILSVAAVRFNLETGVISDKFMKVVNIDSCIKLGLGVDGGTLTWWFNQSEEAREHLKGKSNTIKSVLHSLSQFFRPDDQVWGNSARFGLGVLADAYKRVGEKLPWKFWNERDVRTLVSFKPEVKNEVVFEGEPHNPIDDCIHQINYCHLTWRLISR